MLSCKQASQLVSQSLDRPLNFRERFALRIHLMLCAACRRFKRQLYWLQHAIQRMVAETEQDEALGMPGQVRERIAQTLESRIP